MLLEELLSLLHELGPGALTCRVHIQEAEVLGVARSQDQVEIEIDDVVGDAPTGDE